jgi:nitric oxide reductase subunit C
MSGSPFTWKGETRMRKLAFLLLLVLVLGLAACGGGTSPTAVPSGGGGNATEGQRIFTQVASPPCSSCHSVDPGVTLVGPSLAGIGTSAGSIESGVSAEEYLRQSIVDPNAFITPGFGANIMPASYGSQLSAQQISDLVAYLMTLK